MNTRAAIIGIGYQLWSRARWVLLGTIVQIGVLAVAVHFLLGSPEIARIVACVGMFPSLLALPFLILVFTYDGDISSLESTFPRHMMVLPLSNAALALTPMLYGIGCLILFAFLAQKFVLVPVGCPPPSAWLILVIVVVLAWLSAMSWTPFWLPYARVFCSAAILCVVVAFVLTTNFLALPDWITIAGLLVGIALAFAAAIIGMARARRGDGVVPPPWAARLMVRGKQKPQANPFRSAERAQIWFELRRNSTAVAFFVLGITLSTIHLLWVPSDGVGSLIVPIPFFPTIVFVIMPIFTLSFIGGNFAKPDSWRSSLAVPVFMAARPISDQFIISAKMKASTLTMIVFWAFVFANVGISLIFPHAGHSETLAQFLHREYTPHRAVIAIAAIVGLVFLSWLGVMKTFLHNLAGVKSIATTKLFANLLLFAVLALLGHWAWRHPESRPAVVSAAQITMWVLIAAKVATAMPIIGAIRRCRIATDAQLRAWAAIWFTVATTLLGVLFWLVPSVRHSRAALIAGVILFLPFNRMIAMPLAWHHNRHR